MASLRRAPARRLAAALGVAALVLLGPRAASAFCRTTTVPIPASYSPTRGCFDQGLPLFWRNACVGYSVNKAGSKQAPLDDATRIVDAAYATWNGITCAATGETVGIAASNLGAVSCAEVRYNPTGPNQNLIVFRDDAWPYSDPNNTLGLTTVTFNAENGEIYDADMEINSAGATLSITDQVPAGGFDLLSVITHEAGHFFGIAHATNASSTMFASYKPGSIAQRTLAADDQAGLCAIYPTATQRVVDKSVSASGFVTADACDPTPRHGFSSGCESNPAPSEDGGGCAMGAAPGSGGLGGGAGALGVGALAAFAALAGLGRRVAGALGRTRSG